ncbi:MAG: DNA polymerase I [Gemmatimonadota bacterium]|nr:DNA polymerase I [Gemmatimonadota bacterium]MDE2865484.1 DNA polymerase I [Gemmatimonadota bacterium]
MEIPDKTAPRLFLIDAYALIYRSFFAFINRPLTNARGENTSAPFGFANFLQAIRDEYQPDYIAVVFDSGRSHREELYPDYKATRAKMPRELRDSLPRIRELVAAFGDRVVEVEGWEADDVIGTLAARAVAEGLEAVIVSGDKDFFQLVGDRVHLLNPGRGGAHGVAAEWLDASGASKKFGVGPGQVVDYLALVGDSSDNVPGAPGIGPKTAQKLLHEYGTVEEVLAHAEEIKAKRPRESLLANGDDVLLSKQLVTIQTDLELDADLSDLRVSAPDNDRLRALYVELEFRTLVERLDRERAPPGAGEPQDEAAPAEYRLVTDPAQLAEIATECRQVGAMAIVVLNRTLEPTRDQVAGIAIAADPHRCHYLPVSHEAAMSLELGDMREDLPDNLPALDSAAFEPIRRVLADPAVPKVGHDLKRSLIACRRAGLQLAGPLHDVMVASYVLDPGRRRQDPAALASDFLGRELTSPATLLGTGRKRRHFGDIAANEALHFACEQVEVSLRLWHHFAGQMASQGLERLFRELEMPLIPVLAEMEMHGVGIDAGFFAAMSARLVDELRLIREDIHKVAGTEFNINSTPQLREILFERLGLPVIKRTRTGPSTDSSVLEELAARGHELPRLMMDYRQLEKLRNTYVDALPALVNPATKRIHTTFNQAVAATGRLSSSDPNLQNIPIRTTLGREIRRGFVSSTGSMLVTADYSQIELRILAHFSGDEVFVRAFREDKDVHRETAAVIFDVPVDEVTGGMRDQAKTVNFATLYGQGPFGLSRQLGISMDEAKRFIAQYFERFAGVRRFLDEQVAQARDTGYVETLLGRRRYIPELRARAWNVRQFGERVAQNTPIQGTAADLIKVAMIRVGEALGDDSGARMLLQVHDELVFEVEDGRVEEVTATVVDMMESALTLSVPLRVDAGSGRTWYDCKT